MMRLQRRREPRQRESPIALINIVFLMLIFFLIAGTLAPSLDNEVSLIVTGDAEQAAPPDALFVTQDGRLKARGHETDVDGFLNALKAQQTDPDTAMAVKIAADRELPAERLIEVVDQFRTAGIDKVSIVTERAGQ